MSNHNQNENALPIPGNNSRAVSDLLPRYFRTEANKKFLQSTLDQLVQPGVAEKISGFFGRKNSKAYTAGDNYIGDVSKARENYQLEPAVVIKDNLDNVTFYKDYNDYINQLKIFGANTSNHSRLNSQETYAWNPNIDWDKFVNFREYYWIPTGPKTVRVTGQAKEVVSTYTVRLTDNGDSVSYLFSPDGFTSNPSLKLYRGQTYRFDIDCVGHPMAIAISRTFTPGNAVVVAGREGVRGEGLFDAKLYGNDYDLGDYIILPDSGSVTFDADENVSTLYPDGIRKLGEAGEEIANVYIEKGIIEFTIPINAPDKLYYISKNDVDVSGLIKIYDIEENTFLDVETEILGKKTYKSANGVEFTNGLKVEFLGTVVPKIYGEGNWYVEGVGDKIRLIEEKDLIIPASYTANINVPFDSEGFDTLPFSDSSSYAKEKDYIVINRSSKDRNPWSRYNKWIHKDVLIKTAEYNKIPFDIDENLRAKRPIIEFEAGLKLYNYGSFAKLDVDLVDAFTLDVFSTIEGSLGYNIDGIDVADGMRILFTADRDKLVNGKIYQVKFVTIGNNRQISLIEVSDSEPLDLETVFVINGNNYGGKTFHYHGNRWMLAQEKTKRNQPPLFELVDAEGNNQSNSNIFNATTFKGTKIFSYKIGNGANDIELGFPLSYKNIENSGDIEFEFNLLTDTFTYQTETDIISVSTSTSCLKKFTDRTNFDYVNGWSKTPTVSKQKVIRQYVSTQAENNNFQIDVYNKAAYITDLRVNVFVNNKLKKQEVDYTLDRINEKVFVRFFNDLEENSNVILKTDSTTPKNDNGWYDFPINLERNPLNEDISTFTLGEVIDHVDSMIEDIYEFTGTYPGPSNLRDLGELDVYGKRFVKHSSPLNLALYHITNKKYNIVKAMDYSRKEYARFKRIFIETASTLGYDGEIKQHVDLILKEINRDKVKSQPFYFSDMINWGNDNKVIEYEVLDPRNPFYPLSEVFDITVPSQRAVNVYLNGYQLVHNKDYTFNNEGFLVLDSYQQEGDILRIYESSSTDGSFIPPTPTKLGLYPSYVPQLIIDDTYLSEEPVINGPFKIYGEDEATSKIGWFYPVYTSRRAAQNADSNNAAKQLVLAGYNRVLYIPTNTSTEAGTDNVELDEYPVGTAVIRGHDGSFVKAFKDYRDALIIDLEKRIFNNIKVFYNPLETELLYGEGTLSLFDFVPGKFRKTEFTRNEINESLRGAFVEWLSLVETDYTSNYFYERENQFTFNYSSMTNVVDGTRLPGFWRGVYKEQFDTDRPHSHPWEILGFTIKPKWWNEVYGPAPYTGNNGVMWSDIEKGIIREPGKQVRVLEKFARPGLTSFIPVDGKGRLLSPIAANIAKNFVYRNTTQNFEFGDEAPVETAWRRSSEYPFAILRAWLLNQPSKAMGVGFDTSRLDKNLVGQYVYKDTKKHITLVDLQLPNTYEDASRIQTSGLINFIYNLVASNILTVYNDYKTDLVSIRNQLGLKLGGFTDKQKLKIVLDSRSPKASESEGVFVPEENYQVFLNTSSPVETIVYSGVIVEKAPDGFIVRGYNNEVPYFKYFQTQSTQNDITVVVGGITESASEWAANRRYVKGQLLINSFKYYRVTDNFTSGPSFTTNNLALLSDIPIVGGKRAQFKKNFLKSSNKILTYGTKLSTSQDVVDFLLGYDAYLKYQGFTFDYFNRETNFVENWDNSAREFLFWTTQGWASGTTISLSPGATSLNLSTAYSVADDILNAFYSYGVVKQDGDALDRKFISIYRNKNVFEVRPKNTNDGIYGVSIPVVQKEHVLLIDNTTVFNDIIYQPSTGYRQERLKVTGYRSDNWTGGLDIPGFIFDDATITDWEPWQDYSVGSLVKFKQFYYVAIYQVTGSEEFNSNFWYRLNEKPVPKLYTNFDYKINQFSDFYDLDSDNFDAEQQRLAQHLIGYQKREYLANIINDDISQYKFYQGFIQDKGTKNAITKLFDPLSGSDRDSFDFYEEWAIQVGRYGAVDNVQQVEYTLEEKKFQEAPQPVQLVNQLPVESFDSIYRIRPFEVYDKPEGYNHKPFPTTTIDPDYLLSSGYVHEEDVEYKAGSIDDLEITDINQLQLGQYIWLTRTNSDGWTVYQISDAIANVTALEALGTFTENNKPIFKLTLDKWAAPILNVGELIAVKGATEFNLTGIHEVDFLDAATVNIVAPIENEIETFDNQKFVLVKLRQVRVSNLAALNNLIQEQIYDKQKVWVDNYKDNNWGVYQNSPVYGAVQQALTNPALFDSTDHRYSTSMTATDNNYNLFVSAPGDGDGVVYHYRRTKDTNNLIQEPAINPDRNLFNTTNSNFGESISVSPDGEFLAIGIPDASQIKTRFRGDFDPTQTYNKNEIVKYRESLWKANRVILPTTTNQPFSTFDTYVQLVNEADSDSTAIKLLISGNPGLDNSISDHFLVRAPLDMYLGTKSGDLVKLGWNSVSFAYPTLDPYTPFDNELPELSSYIENTHEIQAKIDHILFVETFVGLPEVGERVTTNTGSGIVHYVDIKGDSAVIYVKETNGTFDLTGELFIDDADFIGFYSEEETYNVANNLGGFWLFKTYKVGEPPETGYTSELSNVDGFTYNNNSRWYDIGRGLVYVDVVTEEHIGNPGRPFNYYNIQKTISDIGVYISNNNQASFIGQLTYFGDPGRTYLVDTEGEYPSNLWVVRGSKVYTDTIETGDHIEFRLYDLDNRTIDLASAGLSYNILNKEQTVYDLWDGYIDFEYTRFNADGDPYEPVIGDILQDIQTPFDEFGGLALTSYSTSTAEVVFYQRKFNFVRVFVKNKTGNWARLNNTGRVEVRRLANVTARGSSDVSRTIATINDFNNDVVLGNDLIGKLVVFQHTSNFPLVSNPYITDEEYYFFNEVIDNGAARDENPPNSLNKDYTQVYNIPGDEFGAVGPNSAGAVAIYNKTANGSYKLLVLLSSEYATTNRKFGQKVKIIQNKGLYTLFASSVGDTLDDYGSIEIFKHGYEPGEYFKGNWKVSSSYLKNDIVRNRDNYYKAIKNISPDDSININNSIYWNKISWRQAKDENYQGALNTAYPYSIGSIVSYDGSLYRAKTNIAAGSSLNFNEWELVSNNIDYLGYLPNRTSNAFYGEEIYSPSSTYIEQFAIDYDVSDSGSVIAVLTKEVDSDSTSRVNLVIYRLIDEQYLLDQTIELGKNTTRVSISPQGNIIAVSEPENDERKTDQGKVVVYRQVNGAFAYAQTLLPPQNEESEKFGSSISFSDDNFVVSSLNGDMKIPTTFDVDNNNETTFDRDYTTFKNVIKDTGVVYIFEDIEDSLVYSESFRYDNATIQFGETLLSNGNHIYVGMQSVGNDNYKGTILNYRKPKNSVAWNRTRELVPPVDVSKIRGAFLYNKRTNQIVTYLDYIDPIQGKIAGPAEQEITHRVPYDPATYNVGVFTGVDKDTFWAEEHVGEVWWNLKTARFTYPYQGDIQYQKANWNELQPGSSIDVYEWVESRFLPSQWDTLADSESALNEGISGVSIYGDNLYTQKFVYDPVSKTFSNRFYFWVGRKLTVPKVENRSLSVFDIARLIATPREQGYRFINFLGSDRFLLNNCDSLIYNDDIVLNIKYATGKNTEQQLHSAYYIMSEGLESSSIHPDIERKWFDSLIGFDEQNRTIPDTKLTVKQKYGVQNRPRQSMFVNREEALKQVIERINSVLITESILDSYNTSALMSKDNEPTEIDRTFDSTIDTLEELRFVSTNKISQAVLTPIIQNGRIVRVDIDDPGRGYKVVPTYTLVGPGTDAEFEFTINNLGQITGVTILNSGRGYDDNTRLLVRKYSVLVKNDASIHGKWAIYSWNNEISSWFRSTIQGYDVTAYWSYADWYANGYNTFTKIDHEIDVTDDIFKLNVNLGSTVRIANVGSGGWILLEKIAAVDSEDYTVNYKTIGRQNGTIQFKDTLYNFQKNTIGFDNRNYDSVAYDNLSARELRIILNAIKKDIFVGNLKVEYNKLFFASLRYILTEQNYVDWFFKTSFIKIKHNVGKLEQDLTFNTDTLPSYKKYVEEVKPYKTVIREFVSAYETIENTNSSVSDFDLPPFYSKLDRKNITTDAIVVSSRIISNDENLTEYPRKNWLDNVGYIVKEIQVKNGGSGFLYKPVVRLVGGGGTGATAEAYLGYGKVTSIKVINPGKNYITAPQVIIEGSQLDTGTPATASAILGSGVVRTPTVKIKFDRTSKNYFISTLDQTENFTGESIRTVYDLEWPIDLQPKNIKVYIDNEEQLRSTYTCSNATNKDNSYTRQQGRLKFVKPPALDAAIRIEYKRPLSMLNASDRINFAYNPLVGMLGKDLAQLMDGVDYGGVEVTSFDFGGPGGWDVKGWYTDTWDTFDNTFEDEVFTFDGSTSVIELSTVFEDGVIYNVYLNGDRIDDPNFGTPQQYNPNARMPSIIGDGETKIIDLGEYGFFANDNDVLIVRKYTSDGSFIPDPESYDTALSGGDLPYTTAKGVRAEEIVVDGDGFVTPTTSKGPEELVPGQVLDTVDIKVYTRDSVGQGMIYSQSYIMDATVSTYSLGVVPGTRPSIFVKMDNRLLTNDEYTVDWENNSITILTPIDGVELNILTVERGGQDIVDYGRIIADASTTDYEISRKYVEGMTAFVTVDGVQIHVVLYASELNENAVIRFEEVQDAGAVIHWTLFSTDTVVNYSVVSKETFVADGVNNLFVLTSAPFYSIPTTYNIMVKVENRILNPGYNIQYEIPANRQREYPLESFQQPGNALLTENINVYINGEQVFAPTQWRFDIFNSSVILSDAVGDVGDTLEIYVISDGEYQLNGTNLTIGQTPNDGDTVEVFKFSNHDLVGIERINYDVVARDTLIAEDIDYVTYNRLTVGEIKLRKPAADVQYVWVSVNGELLTPSVDYYLVDNKKKVRLVRRPAQNDAIDIIHFTQPVSQPKFAFRQFKDMLNRTHYKRLDAPTTVLAQPLNSYDLRIEVEDGTNLPLPNKGGNLPGIIFVNGERIEYLVKEGNTLRQLRRGTLGTGVKDTHDAGSDIYDQSMLKTVPYKDVTQIQKEEGNGVTSTWTLNFKAQTVNEFDVFVAGRRLRKTAIAVFNPIQALDSTNGDTVAPAEFTLNNTVNEETGEIISSQVELAVVPGNKQTVNFIRKIGKTWAAPGETLSTSQADIGIFLRAGTTKLPE